MNKRILCLSLISSFSQDNEQHIYVNPGRTVIVDVNLDGYNGEFDTGKNHVWNGLSLAREHN
ncbi:hypothetical protein C9J44_18525 [Photobacterium sp. GB-27]|uniref:hypothetical protein n=1 Tax=unclassified Photobacterium TaxID=2628852 RepID=UPI000D1699B5|nr:MULTISPECIES: hypothetical protein [unclassified Photobacterium]PSV27803.1 hypothetical protein C9J42_05430 [Photobacterium sp. GB-56]PSV32055.1 hypothetical protein C9J40_06255 [Photobacterium sp. GB-72]PSV32783.1 hypothetical protein C9J44_18525 [Photobacterium sp. GB-27]PSV56823.1 hypothetical protein C9J43_10320 [Photobacterium sp. GB-3]